MTKQEQDKRPDKPPVGQPFTWVNGPLTGMRIQVTENVLNGRRWSEWDTSWGTCEADLIPPLTGTIGPLFNLSQANKCLYPLPGVQGLRTSTPEAGPYEEGDQYMVIWDRREDEPYPVIDSYYEGELRAFGKIITTVDSWKEVRRKYHEELGKE